MYECARYVQGHLCDSIRTATANRVLVVGVDCDECCCERGQVMYDSYVPFSRE